MGPRNNGDIDFSLCKARVYARHWGLSYGQSPAKCPAQIPVGKREITLAGLDIELNAPPFHNTAGMMLRSKLGTQVLLSPAPRGQGLLVH